MNTFLNVLALLCLFSTVNAQSSIDYRKIFISDEIVEGSTSDLFFLCQEKNTSPQKQTYLDSSWKEIQILNQENKLYKVPGRFRTNDSSFEFKFLDRSCDLYSHIIAAVYANNTVFVPSLVKTKYSEDYAFLQLLSKGEINLLQKVEPKNSGKNLQLFFKYEDNDQSQELVKKKKIILKVLSSKANAIESFVKKHDLDYRNTSDLIRIFDFYNQNNES
jgi:hypothetical protein